MSVIKDSVRAMKAYAPPLEGRNPDSHLLLDFNERTLSVPDSVRQAIAEFENLHVYPSYGDAVERIADYAGVDPKQLLITNGSDQGIEIVIRSMQGSEMIMPVPAFPIYAQVAQVQGMVIKEVPYVYAEGYPFEAVKSQITEETAVIVVAQPNNPTGTEADLEAVFALAQANPNTGILIDECYFEYSGITAKDRVSEFRNLFVTRTFSKTFGLSALRLGYVISAAENIVELSKVRGPYDVNMLSIAAAKSALLDPSYVREYVSEVMEQAKPKLEAYFDSKGVKYWPSVANYLFCYFKDPEKLAKSLETAGILVRPKCDAEGKLGLRVSVGTVRQVDRLISELEEVL